MSYIAESAGGFAFIGRDGKLYIRAIYQDEQEISLELFGEYKWGEQYKISKVSYENGVESFKFGDDTGNNLWLNQENMYIVEESQVESIYKQLKNLTANSFEGKVIIDPALDVGDKIIIDGKPVIYQGEADFQTRFIAEIDSKISIKQKQETTAKTTSQKVFNRRVQSRIDEAEGKITQLVQETTEQGQKLTEVEQTVDGITQTVSSVETKVEQVEDKADNAQSTADSATQKAETAQDTADNAQTSANNAQSTADGAVSQITTTNQKVSRIEQTVNGITQSVSEVEEKVETVEGKADAAQSTANTANSTANQAKSTADSVNNNLTTNYYTKTQTNSQIQQTADTINQTIQQNVQETNRISGELEEQSSKITEIEASVEGITQTVQDIENVTEIAEGNKTITLEDCVEGNLLELHIYGNNEVFDYLYPSNDLYPADNLYPYGDSRIVVTDKDNNSTTYELGITDVLRKNGEVCDEYVLKDGKASVIRRINNDGTIKSTEQVEKLGEYEIKLKDGTNILTIKNYSASLKVKFAYKNDYTEIFATKVEMNSSITQTAEEINLEVSKKVDENEVISKINQSAEQIQISANKISLQRKRNKSNRR